MRSTLFSLCCLTFLFSGKAQKRTGNTNDLAAFIKKKGDSLFNKHQLQGLFVGVLNKGKRQYFNFGYAVPEEKIPFNPATLFEAGSITKTFTAYLVESILAEKGIADTTSIISYLPDSVLTNKALESISFLSLLNHTSGLPRLPVNMNLSTEDRAPYDRYTAEDLYAFLKTARPQPDGKSNYSNLGMGLAGHLAERLSGKSYATLLQEYILQPFGIRKGNVNPTKSVGYFNGEKTPYWNMNVLAPAGGLQCTADEMLTYLAYISKPKDTQRATVIEKVLQPTVAIAQNLEVGRGWMIMKSKAKQTIYWHNGGTYGFSTFAAFAKDTEQAVVVVVNQFNANEVSDRFGMTIMQKMLE